MCGIVGSLKFSNSTEIIVEADLLKMRDSMTHRGPDSGGIWIADDGRVGLAHRRLSIIDLSEKASQPMSGMTSDIQIVFNGEIYNHTEIRRDLEKIGKYTWKTDHSDTEVIVHAYEEWGIDFIYKLRGMFAIAIWDNRIKALWLIRDRLGIKPLYYSINSDRIVFASEIKALLQDPQQKREINERSFYDYLSFLSVPAPNTLFKGINKLASGCFLRIDEDGVIYEERYWDLLDHHEDLSGLSESQISDRLLGELRDSVQIHKASDVPVGVFLSGGIDSSTNAALLSECGERVKTFTVGYDGNYASYKNELEYARLVSNRVGAQYHETILNAQDLIDFLPKMVALQDEPIGDPVCIPVFYVSKLARENGVIVCQVGEGADELFWGYPSWKIALRMQLLSRLPFIQRLSRYLAFIFEKAGLDMDWRYEYIRRSGDGLPIFWGGAEVLTHKQKDALLSPRMRSIFKGASSWEAIIPIRTRFEEKSNGRQDSLKWMSYLDLNFRLPELLLMRVDKMSMGASVETRVPFLDHKFVQFSMSIPSSLKTQGGILKNILKKAVRGVIPNEVIDRKKQGFAAPITDWFSGELGELARLELREFCMATDLLDWPSVESLLNGKNSSRAWHLLNAALWWRLYIKPTADNK